MRVSLIWFLDKFITMSKKIKMICLKKVISFQKFNGAIGNDTTVLGDRSHWHGSPNFMIGEPFSSFYLASIFDKNHKV